VPALRLILEGGRCDRGEQNLALIGPADSAVVTYKPDASSKGVPAKFRSK
jgi:hypothetical protein